jgi:hypothetical protein
MGRSAKGWVSPRAGLVVKHDPMVMRVSALCTQCSSVNDVQVDRHVPVAISLVGESCSYCGRVNSLREYTRRTA